jgi:hypothetical protein
MFLSYISRINTNNMKRNYYSISVFIMGAALILLQSCSKEDLSDLRFELPDHSMAPLHSKTTQTFHGPAVHLGNGSAYAWIMQSKDGTPQSIGVTLSERALQNLGDDILGYVLELPGQAGSHFYTHVLMDWNPHGHEPPGVYDLPHFDFHFYIIPNEDRLAIGPDDVEQFANAPEPMYIPPDYFMIPGGIPQMGAHWLDGTSPELHGETFTSTFIWGSFDGEFIFWEPMITRDYLLSQPDDEFILKQPTAYKRAGWYPANFKIKYDEVRGAYIVALTGLTYHEATPAS